MVSDNTNGSPNGSLLLLIGAGGTGSYGGFSNSLAPGQFVSGGDIILGAGGFNSNSGFHDETNTAFDSLTAGVTGQAIALRWFPQITYAQFLASVTPIVGENFGTYNPLAAGNGSDNPDGGDLWVVPGPQSTVNLNFFTTDDPNGPPFGTQAPMEGFANSSVTAIPEPATWGAAALAALGTVIVGRKFRNKQS